MAGALGSDLRTGSLVSTLTPLNKAAREIELAGRPGDRAGDEWRVFNSLALEARALYFKILKK